MSDCMQSDVSDAPEFGVNFRDGEIQWPISSILLFLPMRKQPRKHWVSRFTAASPVARGFARYRADEAEIAVECLRDWGFSARILENAPRGKSASERGATKAA
jgi:hypothetical protein